MLNAFSRRSHGRPLSRGGASVLNFFFCQTQKHGGAHFCSWRIFRSEGYLDDSLEKLLVYENSKTEIMDIPKFPPFCRHLKSLVQKTKWRTLKNNIT